MSAGAGYTPTCSTPTRPFRSTAILAFRPAWPKCCCKPPRARAPAPALPDAWPTGWVRGLRARGGFTLDLSWKDGCLVEATLSSSLGLPARVEAACLAQRSCSVERISDGAVLPIFAEGEQIVFETQPGEAYRLSWLRHEHRFAARSTGNLPPGAAAVTETRLRVGSLGEMMVHPGFYLYVGSAFGPGGLRARVGRHIAGSGPLRWHIDYLRRVTQPVETWCAPEQRCEHEWAQSLAAAARVSVPLARFGASDCRCPAHLFFLKGDLDPPGCWRGCKLAVVQPGDRVHLRVRSINRTGFHRYRFAE